MIKIFVMFLMMSSGVVEVGSYQDRENCEIAVKVLRKEKKDMYRHKFWKEHKFSNYRKIGVLAICLPIMKDLGFSK